jgi:hypothetical protein
MRMLFSVLALSLFSSLGHAQKGGGGKPGNGNIIRGLPNGGPLNRIIPGTDPGMIFPNSITPLRPIDVPPPVTTIPPKPLPEEGQPSSTVVKIVPQVIYKNVEIRITGVHIKAMSFESATEQRFSSAPLMVVYLSLGGFKTSPTVKSFANSKTRLTDSRDRIVKHVRFLENDLYPTGQIRGPLKIEQGRYQDVLVFEKPEKDAGDLLLQLGQDAEKDSLSELLIPNEIIEVKVRK